jgi:tetratricopeptide (TPR) repeat protein
MLMFCSGCAPSTCDTSGKNLNATALVPEDSLDEARRLVAIGDFDAARALLKRYLQVHSHDSDAWEMAGDGAMQANDSIGAIGFYDAAVNTAEQPSQGLWLKWAGATVIAHRPFETIFVLRLALTDYPHSVEIRQNLASFLSRVGLQNEAAEHLQWLVQRKHGSQSMLLQLCDLTTPQTHAETCRSALVVNPNDLRPGYSLAALDLGESNWKGIEQALWPVIQQHPDFLPALALYGRAIVELDDRDAVLRWSQMLPESIETYSQYWIAGGLWALRHNELDQAAHAFWRALKLNEDDPEVLTGLSRVLTRLGRMDEASIAVRRAEKIAALRSHVASLGLWDFDSQKTVVDLALSLHELGRPWEATNWLMIAFSMKQHPDSRLEQTYRAIRSELSGTTPWQVPEALVSTKMDLSTYPAIVWHHSTTPTSRHDRLSSRSDIKLRDEAQTRSLQHVCAINKPAGQESGLMIHQSGAGGAGAIDFDLDGWPDLYLTVMDGTPNHADSQPNRLHRNLAGTFSDATESSLLVDRGYAQGFAVGDYDSDGWPDVYVANIGENRLYRNHGDGTFEDVTDQCKLHGTGWTTSVAIADLNNDGHADIFEVGYCHGVEPLNQDCVVDSIGEARSCSPLAFDPEPDRIWSGNGDGTFSEATQWLGPHQSGRGFALVIGDLDHQTGLDTYVANDMTANHFWTKPVHSNEFRLSEQAALRGLAFNARSVAQASMGIAAADADNDGDLDFLVTNFSDDYNTFYQQDQPGYWSDLSQVAGLVESSKPMLAYGTQWIDVDNDGILEVFIANGDIDDFTFEGRSFRQPAQMLQQAVRGRWELMPPDQLGDYFSQLRLGRAVAMLDANRDGLSDFVVTHLFDPVALLINHTKTNGKQTRFFLRARTTHRDAIGTSVQLLTNGQTVKQQLLAGNGYQCANEACIVFGGSNAETLDNVEVHWPGSTRESLGDLMAGGDYLVIEGLGASRF